MISRLAILCLAALIPLLNGGCNVIGYAAAATPQQTKPTYVGLAGQSIAVMVWADPALRIDWPGLQLDLASSLQNKLAAAGTTEQLKGATFPVRPASVARYQLDHPEIESQPIHEVATKIGVSRLIYLEIEDFNTRSVDSLELYRGTMSGTLTIVEVESGIGRVAYEENGLRVVFPPKTPQEGLPRGNDYKFYLGTVDGFTTEVMRRLIPMEIP